MKVFISIVIKAISMLLLALSLVSWGDSWDQIKKTAKDITSVEAVFVQTKHMEILSKPLVSKGTLTFHAPDSLRWEYTSPVRSVLLMHGGTVTRYVKRGDAVIKDSSARLQSMRVVIQELTMWMKGNFDANPSFKPELKKGGIIQLTPREKSMADIIRRIELRLSSTPGVIRSVVIYESQKSYTMLEFRNVRLNRPVPDSIFRNM
ncbi:MAG: outer membrane lipoprotein carrier protein LolA [Spirochaetes bacterium]|nr:outer membrane lipoprotein carrier protein LolA [Spirochaetota bacterium]